MQINASQTFVSIQKISLEKLTVDKPATEVEGVKEVEKVEKVEKVVNEKLSAKTAALTSQPPVPTNDVRHDALTAAPATIVEISNAVQKEPTQLYEPPVEIIQVRNTHDKSPTAAKISQQLSSDLTNIRAKKNGFSVQTIFSQIGALSRETSAYKNEARSFRVLGNKASDKIALDFSAGTGKPQETVTLRIRTKDGDSIDIKVQRSSGPNGDNLEFSFNVTGKLSEGEQDALEKLSNKLGSLADDFFRTGNTQLHGLNEFDKTNLQDFHIDFSKLKTSDTYSTMSYDFSVDETSETQHLIAKDADGYNVDITTDLKNLLKIMNAASSDSASNAMNAYLTIIRETLNGHQPLTQDNSNTLSTQFILDSFTSMVGTALPPLPNLSPPEKAVNAFATGLPDFTAVINAPLMQKISNYNFPEAMSLKLAQVTEIETQPDGRALVKQINSFERHSSQIEGIIGTEKGDLATGNFIYKTINEKQQTSRILDFAENDINNVVIEHTSSTDNMEKTYRNFHLEDVKKNQHSERQLAQLIDEIAKHKDLKQTFESLNYLSLSHQRLFF